MTDATVQMPRPSTRWTAALIGIALVAVLIRGLAALTVPRITGPDAGRYHEQGLALAEGRPYYLTDTAPVYPSFVAVVYRLFGVRNGLSVQLAQALGWGMAVALIGLIGRRLFGDAEGLLAAAFAAVYSPFIRHKHFAGSVYLATENVFIWLVVLLIWWCVKGERLTTRRACLAGLTLGLATLTRPMIMLFPAGIAVWWLLCKPADARRWGLHLAALVLSTAAVILPWSVRNYRVYREVVPVIPFAGFGLLGGNNPHSDGHFVDVTSRPEYRAARDTPGAVAQDRAYLQAAIQFWRSSTPGALGKLLLKKTFLFWTDFGDRYNIFYGVMVPFAWLGLWLTRRNTRALILHAWVVYNVAFCLVFFAEVRMRLPIEPALILAASAGLLWFVRRFRRPVVPAVALAGWLFLHLAIFRFWPSISRAINVI